MTEDDSLWGKRCVRRGVIGYPPGLRVVVVVLLQPAVQVIVACVANFVILPGVLVCFRAEHAWRLGAV